jgi:hypothetical protein
MAKTTNKKVVNKNQEKATPKATPNLFARAKSGAATAPKKKAKGTTIVLPKDLDKEGNLTGESRLLHEAVADAIRAKADEAAANGRYTAAVSLLKEYGTTSWCELYAKQCIQPETPVTIQNHKGQQVTYVVQDKCGQNAICQEQIELLQALLGEEGANELINECEAYGFNPDVMKQNTLVEGMTVQDIVFEVVSNAIIGHEALTDDQKAELITSKVKTYLKKGTVAKLAQYCGAKSSAIAAFLECAGSAIVRYVKT